MPYTPLYHQPPKIPTSVIHQNNFSNPPSTLTSSYQTPSVSSTDIGSLLNQISHSQELLKHSLSEFANEVSLLKTTLTPFFTHHSPLANSNNLQTHNGYHYQDLSHTQQQQPPPHSTTPNTQSSQPYHHPSATPIPHRNKIVSHPYLLTTTINQNLCFSSLILER